MRNYTLLAVLVAALALLIGCSAAPTQPSADVSSAPSKTSSDDPWGPGPEQTVEPDPEPSPDGTFTGSCDYTVPMDSDYKLIGDIEATNTGNVGIEVKVTIKWHQMGYDPVAATKTLRVKPDETKTARFNKSISMEVLTRVQSFHSNHKPSEYCEYGGVMVDTFGKPQS